MLFGFTLVAFGSYLMINVSVIGIAPFTALYVLLAKHWLTVGTWIILIQIIFLVVTYLIDRQLPKIGTFINMFFTGMMTDLFLYLNVLPNVHGWFLIVAIYILGVIAQGFGVALAIQTNLGTGAITLFSLALLNRYQIKLKTSIFVLETTVAVSVFFLGGAISVGTVFYGILCGYFTEIGVKVWNRVLEKPKTISS